MISGTVAGEHEAGFIGVKAREKNRRDRIAACKDALACNEKAQKNHCGEIEELKSVSPGWKRSIRTSGRYGSA